MGKRATGSAADWLAKASSAERCRCCGCFHSVLIMLEDLLPVESGPPLPESVIEEARRALADVRYNCLGCKPCLPLEALKILKGMSD